MSLIYALVAREKTKVLCDFTDHVGTFEQMALRLLPKIQDNVIATIAFDT